MVEYNLDREQYRTPHLVFVNDEGATVALPEGQFQELHSFLSLYLRGMELNAQRELPADGPHLPGSE